MHLSHVVGENRGYIQNGNNEDHTARLDVRLDSVDFYEDAALRQS